MKLLQCEAGFQGSNTIPDLEMGCSPGHLRVRKSTQKIDQVEPDLRDKFGNRSKHREQHIRTRHESKEKAALAENS
jgi:hypothetical protein